MNIETVTVEEIISAARTKQASLVAESAGHVVLALGRSVAGIPLQIDPERVAVTTEGSVGMTGTARTVAPATSAGMLRGLLRALLAASQGAPGALAGVARARPDGADGVEDVFAELAAALIPINRGAAKRALARLARETLRAKTTGCLRPEPAAVPSRTAAPEAPPEAKAEPPKPTPDPEPSCREPAPEPPRREPAPEPEPARSVISGKAPVAVFPTASRREPVVASWTRADVELSRIEPSRIDMLSPPEVPAVADVQIDDRFCMMPDEITPTDVDATVREAEPRSKTAPSTGTAPSREAESLDDDASISILPAAQASEQSEDAAASSRAASVEASRAQSEDVASAQPAIVPPSADHTIETNEASHDAARAEAVDPVLVVTELSAVDAEAMAVGEPVCQPQAPVPEPDIEWPAPIVRATEPSEPAAISVDWSVPKPRPVATDDLEPLSVDWSEPPAQATELSESVPVSVDWSEPAAEAAEPPQSLCEPPAQPAEAPQPRRAPEPAPSAPAASALSTEPPPARTQHIEPPMMRVSDALAEARYRSVEALLDEFGEDAGPGRSRAVLEATRALKRFVQIATPTPPLTAADDQTDGRASWPSPVAGLTRSANSSEPPSIPPQAYEPRSLRKPRATLFASATLLVLGVLGVVAVWLTHPEFFAGRASPLSRSPAAGSPEAAAAASPKAGGCVTTLILRDLPSPHEVLVRLGSAPLETRPLPVGVRLELVATAPGHKPKRVVVPADATWSESVAGQRSMKLQISLEPGATTEWPDAPLGEVGGVGPAGQLDIEAVPPGTELWLVANAGVGAEQSLTVSCDDAPHLMVVNPLRPTEAQRITLAPSRLRAAAESGGLVLSVVPPAPAAPIPPTPAP